MQNVYNSQESSAYSQQEKPDLNNLHRMARFGANIADAYGCYIFLPPWLISPGFNNSQPEQIVLAGAHSLSNDLVKNCSIEVGHGLIGWVAKHKRSIHVSPFERDSRTLGLYHSDQSLKSFIGIPIFIEASEKGDAAGVIACDSKKSFAFSKLQGKLLEDLACEISSFLRLNSKLMNNSKQNNSWQNFLNLSTQLSDSIGRDSVEILRVKIDNYPELEKVLGSGRALAVCKQLHRLIEQSIPSNFPQIKFTNGDMVIALDNMMTSFIENKILALSEHCACPLSALHQPRKISVRFSFHKQASNARKNRGLSLEELIQMTSEPNVAPTALQSGLKRDMGLIYEYKRA